MDLGGVMRMPYLSLASVWELQIKMQLGKIATELQLAAVLREQQQQF
jgi:PIN domain nuclease of toxin-antitoxin system